MNYDIIRIGMEAELSLELHRLFQGQVIEKVIQDAKVEPESDHSKDLLGNDFKISARMAPGLYKLCQEVLARLKFKKKTEFFVFNSSEVDCFALPSFENEQSHLIMITSGMIERFDEDELRFILGHEIGHLLSNNSMLHKIIRFIFPNLKKAPLVFQNKISLWKKLAEFTADRYGYIASPNLEKCVTCFYKLASGLNVKRFEFNPQNYLEEMEEILEFFKNEPYASHSTHPINPLRIKAIELFNQSQLYQQILNKKKLEPDAVLDLKISDLIRMLFILGDNPLDRHRIHFLAAGGLLIAGSDEVFKRAEIENIIDALSILTVFPKRFLDEIWEMGRDKVEALFKKSARILIKEDPGSRTPMFEYLVEIALSDNDILNAEMDSLYRIGEKIFKFSRREIAQNIARKIQSRFLPRLYL